MKSPMFSLSSKFAQGMQFVLHVFRMKLVLANLLVFFLIYFAFPNKGNAQQDVLAGKDSSVFTNERIERVEIRAKPELVIPEPKTESPEQSLKYVSPDLTYKPSVPPAQMITMQQDKPTWERLYNHYAKIGLGLFLSPVAKVYINSGRDMGKSWGLRYEHFSSLTGHTGFARFGDNRIGAQGRIIKATSTLYTDLDFRHFAYHYYGIKRTLPESELSDDRWRDSIRQSFSSFSGTFGYKSNYTPSRLMYDVPVRIDYFKDKRDYSEFYFNVLPKLEIRLVDSLKLAISSQFTFGSVNVPFLGSSAQSRVFLDFTPQVAWYTSTIRAKAGFRTNLYSDTADTKFNIYPAVDAEFFIVPQYFSVYAGVEGRTHFNRRMDWVQENPWLAPTAYAAPSFEGYRATVGLRGSVARLSWDVSGYLRQVQDQFVFFSPNNDDVSRSASLQQGMFYAAYDPNMRETGGSLQLSYEPVKNARAGMKLDVRSFQLDSLPAYYHAAPIIVSVNGGYQFIDKLWTDVTLRYIGERPMGLDEAGKIENANGFVDVNLSADYRLSKRFSIFAEVNNLLSQSYYRWRYYIERPLDLRVGLTLAF